MKGMRAEFEQIHRSKGVLTGVECGGGCLLGQVQQGGEGAGEPGLSLQVVIAH